MKMQKTTLTTAIGIALGGVSFSANALLTSSATLDFALGVATTGQTCAIDGTFPGNCKYGGTSGSDIVGSYFTIDTNGDGAIQIAEKTPIGSNDGIHFGSAQDASGAHNGDIDGSELPGIDNPWEFSGNTGMHQTTSSFAVLSDGGSTKTISMGGWNWAWNTLDPIAMVNTGASITCDSSSCSATSNYVLDATFHLAGAGITTVPYTLHLEGTVGSTASAVPVPAAAWLFGSGLLGLLGISKRKQ